MKNKIFGLNLFSGGIAAIIGVVFIAGIYLVRNNMMSNLEKSAEKFLVSQLEEWKSGRLNKVAILVPNDFNGTLSDWESLKLKDYFIEGIKVKSTRYFRKKSLWKSLDKYYMKAYAKVELTMEDDDGYTETYSIVYEMRPRSGGKWIVHKTNSSFPLF